MIEKTNTNLNHEITMLCLGGIMAAGGLMFKQPLFSLGVLVALPVSLLMYRWMAATLVKVEKLPPRRAHNILLGRALLRMFLFFPILAAAALPGPAFLLGVLSGLVLQMLSHFTEAVWLVVKKGGK
ncbi:MAG: hypothetical protein PWP65_592 [Clostridia bacterium]|nr:hypothetical protein [Clostridia bacterium]